MSRLTPDGTVESVSRETKFSGANGNRETFTFHVQLTTSRIDNLTRLIHTLLYVMTIRTYIVSPNLSNADPVRDLTEVRRSTGHVI